MSRQALGPGHLWVQEGSRGEPTLLLLHDPDAVQLSGLGHNAHVEDPERVLRLAEADGAGT